MRVRPGLTIASVILVCSSLHAQDFWTELPQPFTLANLWSVAYGERTLVAAGEEGTIISYHYDDSAWLPRASGTAVWLVGAGYGNGRFVVVGDRGTLLTSDDAGVTWTPRVSGTSARLNAAAYGGGRWLVVGEQGTVLTSSDGTAWTSRPALGSGFLRALAYGQGQFLIGGAGGALFTTTDTITFAPVPIATTADIEGAAISGDRFWVVGSGGLRASATQLDTWMIAPPTTMETFRGVAVRNTNEASAVGHGVGESFLLRPAGAAWSPAFRSPQFLATAITQGLNELVAVGFGGNVARSNMEALIYMVSDADRLVVYGRDVRLGILSGAAPLAYQWTRDGVDIPGATTAELVLPRVSPADARAYGVRVTTSTGTANIVAGGQTFVVVPAGRPDLRDPAFVAELPAQPTLVVTQPDGKLLVAGSFYVTPNGGPTYGLARLNRDGSLDSNFRAGGGISSTASINGIHMLTDGTIYVRGSFQSIGNEPRAGVARLLSTGAVDRTFTPDPAFGFPTNSAPGPNGTLYLQTDLGAASTIVRLATDGSRDPTFPVLHGNELVAVDAQGRVLAVKLETSSTGRLLRYLPNGSPDAGYASTAVTVERNFVTTGRNDLAVTRLTDQGLYVASVNFQRIGSTYSFRRFMPDGRIDGDYASPPPLSFVTSRQGSFAYAPDGSLVIVRSNDNGTSYAAEFYTPDGLPDPSRYATLPNLSPFFVREFSADGSLLSLLPHPTMSTAGAALVRLRPLVGASGRLTNLSVRTFIASTADPLIVGFVTTGTGDTRAVVRAVGPGLTPFGVSDPSPDPRLTLTLNGTTAATNDRWDSSLAPRFARVGAFPLSPGSNDAALEWPIGAGDYTVLVAPAAGSTSGIALAELYESAENGPAPRRFSNVSARGPVAADRALIVGFTITGDLPCTVLVRGAGPVLAAHGVGGVLPDPKLTLHRNDGATVWENDDWSAPNFPPGNVIATAAARVGAFAFGAAGKDAAILVTLAAGSYTAVVTSVNNTSGTALVEVYDVP